MIALDLLGAGVGPFVVGAGSPQVSAVQSALKSAGFSGIGGKALKVDGVMGPNTEAAITAFWTSKGASHAAVIDDDLLNALGVSSATSLQPATPSRSSSNGSSRSSSGAGGASSGSPSAPPDDEDAAAAQRKKMIVFGIGAVGLVGGVLLITFGAKHTTPATVV